MKGLGFSGLGRYRLGKFFLQRMKARLDQKLVNAREILPIKGDNSDDGAHVQEYLWVPASYGLLTMRYNSMNAPVLVDLEGETDPLQIAIKELREKKIPLIVRRYLPDGWYNSPTKMLLLAAN